MTQPTDWDLICRPGGWIRATDRTGESTLYLHVRGSGEGTPQRLNIHRVVMDSSKPISAHGWRRVPFSNIERLANGAGVREQLLLEPDSELPDLDELERYFLDDDGRLTSKALTTATIWAGQQPEQADEQPDPLRKPEGRITDDFLQELAATYRWLVNNGRRAPASVIADQTGAPVATVRRWIANARQRGFLPPGRPGRAG
ncbi:hypothetical protein [Streptomyces chartreusis]